MNSDLKATLMGIFAVGWCDEMKGSPVDDDDEIDSESVSEIEAAFLECMARAESFIGSNYIENPQMVHEAVYNAGSEAYRQAAALWMMRN